MVCKRTMLCCVLVVGLLAWSGVLTRVVRVAKKSIGVTQPKSLGGTDDLDISSTERLLSRNFVGDETAANPMSID